MVAIKEVTVSPSTYIKYNREGLLLRYLTSVGSHEHIVGFVDSFYREEGHQSGKIYLVMECLEGEDFVDYILQNPLSDAETIIDLAGQLCSVLRHLKKLGIAHRDIKLDNMKITKDHADKLKLVVFDFGMARFFNMTRIRRDTNCASTHYAPPELFRHDVIPDLMKRDAYALGVTLYVMLALSPLQSRDFCQIALSHLPYNLVHYLTAIEWTFLVFRTCFEP